MIKLLPNMPDHVVGVTASGRVDRIDFVKRVGSGVLFSGLLSADRDL